jgi:DNA repair protein RadC
VHVTRRLIEAGKVLDIELLDHVIIRASGFVSLRERGLAF